MNQPAWDRQAVVAELRDRIWLDLSPASTGTGVLLDASALLGLPWDDRTRGARIRPSASTASASPANPSCAGRIGAAAAASS